MAPKWHTNVDVLTRGIKVGPIASGLLKVGMPESFFDRWSKGDHALTPPTEKTETVQGHVK